VRARNQVRGFGSVDCGVRADGNSSRRALRHCILATGSTGQGGARKASPEHAAAYSNRLGLNRWFEIPIRRISSIVSLQEYFDTMGVNRS
jgi:hypothetical protein